MNQQLFGAKRHRDSDYDYVTSDTSSSNIANSSIAVPIGDSNMNRSPSGIRYHNNNPNNNQQNYDVRKQRELLPVFEMRTDVVNAVRNNQIVLLTGETGSGKTTQVPRFVAEMEEIQAVGKRVVCTQPRRVAAMSVARRVADEMCVHLGAEVGYNVRFDNKTSEKTKIAYYTDGMLLKEFASDPDLSRYSAVVVDEAHERTVDTDLLLGLLKVLTRRRKDIKVLIMSATLDVGTFEVYFKESNPPQLHVPGRMYDVTIVYSTAPVSDYIECAVDKAVDIHKYEAPGDILVFLTGEQEIERVVTRLSMLCQMTRCVGAPGVTGALVLPLYGSLAIEDQTKVFNTLPSNIRKIICATNIAETSLTIDGVVFVVDCGYHKQSLFNTESRVDCLLTTVISKASAQQRAGRAGRTRPGKCFRLMTREYYERELPLKNFPEITRCDVSSTILYILRLGFENPFSFPFITPPPSGSFISAFMVLDFLGAMTSDGIITDLGRQIVEIPSTPMYARALVKSAKYGCSADVAVVMGMIEAGNVFMRGYKREMSGNNKFAHPHGDHLTLFNIFQGFIRSNRSPQWCRNHYLKYAVLNRAVSVYDQLCNIMDRLKIPRLSTYRPPQYSGTPTSSMAPIYSVASTRYPIEANASTDVLDSVAIRRALAEGLFVHVAYLPINSTSYKPIRESLSLQLPQSSSLANTNQRWVMYDRLEIQEGYEGVLIHTATAVDHRYLIEICPEYFDPSEVPNEDVRAQLVNLMKCELGNKT